MKKIIFFIISILSSLICYSEDNVKLSSYDVPGVVVDYFKFCEEEVENANGVDLNANTSNEISRNFSFINVDWKFEKNINDCYKNIGFVQFKSFFPEFKLFRGYVALPIDLKFEAKVIDCGDNESKCIQNNILNKNELFNKEILKISLFEEVEVTNSDGQIENQLKYISPIKEKENVYSLKELCSMDKNCLLNMNKSDENISININKLLTFGYYDFVKTKSYVLLFEWFGNSVCKYRYDNINSSLNIGSKIYIIKNVNLLKE